MKGIDKDITGYAGGMECPKCTSKQTKSAFIEESHSVSRAFDDPKKYWATFSGTVEVIECETCGYRYGM